MNIERHDYLERLETALRRAPVVALLGPRQCGKTTLAHRLAQSWKQSAFFDLESTQDMQRLQNPELALGQLDGLIILDEIQHKPELFRTLRVLADRPDMAARFLILGSASPQLVRGASESLAGRVEFVELSGFGLDELGADSGVTPNTLWLRGGFPRSCLAASDTDSMAWREDFIRTFLERDLPQFGLRIPAPAMHRFWTMTAQYHGSELARSLGLSDKTLRGYLDILSETFMIRQLQPWHENLSKRQVKSPKIYFRDSGLLHGLLALPTQHALEGHPRVGASWEGFALEQILRLLRPSQAYFWATHAGAELDLLVMHNGKRYGFEFKFSEAPSTTRSMHVAMDDLGLQHLWIVHAGPHAYPLTERISAIPLTEVNASLLG